MFSVCKQKRQTTHTVLKCKNVDHAQYFYSRIQTKQWPPTEAKLNADAEIKCLTYIYFFCFQNTLNRHSAIYKNEKW